MKIADTRRAAALFLSFPREDQRELPDMKSALEGGGGNEKADVVREVCIRNHIQMRTRGGEGQKSEKKCGHHIRKLPKPSSPCVPGAKGVLARNTRINSELDARHSHACASNRELLRHFCATRR